MIEFGAQAARPLPVILLLDCSGSMSGEKIAAVNAAVRELGADMAATRQPQGEVHLCGIQFWDRVEVGPLQPATAWQAPTLVAAGRTAMGGAIDALIELLADRSRVPSTSFAPTVVLISDGVPTDDFEGAPSRLLSLPRREKIVRLAMAIGEDADQALLRRFIGDPEVPLVRANETARIRDFFRWVTLSVQVRTQSRMPDAAPLVAAHLAHIPDGDLVY
jgi:uncharacterized protein YegL